MLCYLLRLILLTQLVMTAVEPSTSLLQAYGHMCSRFHPSPVEQPLITEGVDVDIVFLVHYDRNITKISKYSKLINNIVQRSRMYYHHFFYTRYVHAYVLGNSSVILNMIRDIKSGYNEYTSQKKNRFDDTRIDRGFLAVEHMFLTSDCCYVPNLCIFLTTSPADNKSSATAAAKHLKNSGVNIMTIAVGDLVDKEDVKDFASNEKYAFTSGENISNSDGDIKRHAKMVTVKIKRALKHANVLPKYTRCFATGPIIIITDVDKDHFETLTQLRDFVIDFDKYFSPVRVIMITSTTKDEEFQDHLSSINKSAPGVTFEILDPSYNLSTTIKRGRQNLLNFRREREKIIVIATNKKVESLDDVVEESQLCWESGVHIMALGVGDEVLKDQLSHIVTDPKGLDTVQSIKDVTAGLRNLYRKVCSGGCSSGWTHYNGMCFIYKSDNVKWLAARKTCGDLRAKLVSITTPEKYAWLKHEFLEKHKKPVHIGLRKYSMKGVSVGSEFRWENGRPLVFERWDRSKRPREPDGVSFEECVAWYPDGWRDVVCEIIISAGVICEREAYNVTKVLPKGVKLLPLWKENVCPAPPGGFNRKSGPMIVYGDECRPLLNVHWQPQEMNDIYSCSNGELISQFLLCDNVNHCQDGSDEKHCSEDCTEYQFPCTNGRCVSLAYFCDSWDDCGDNSDEESCAIPRCPSNHWQCDNGQCIPMNAHNDLHYDCHDRSDEGSDKCYRTCDDGTCLPEHWFRDGQVDCGGGRFEDEAGDLWFQGGLCYTGRYREVFKLFADEKYLRLRPNCTLVFDGFGKKFQSFTEADHCRINVTCPIGFYRCPSSFCIPIENVCDGAMDCLDGEEEAECDTYECPGYYRCPGASYCLHPARICDGDRDCPYGLDEVMCGVKCYEGCNCSAGVVECRDVVVKKSKPFDWSTRKVVLAESQVLEPGIVFSRLYYLRHVVLSGCGLQRLNGVFDHQTNLINLNVSHNNLSEISPHVLSKLEKLTSLDISYNPLNRISAESFEGLMNLRMFYMRYTSIEILYKKTFSALKKLEVLDLRGSSVYTVTDEAFLGLDQLRHLYMQGNPINKFGKHVFSGLDGLQHLSADIYSLCCSQVRPRSLSEDRCLSPKSSISSCSDLLGSDVLRSSVWFLCIASVAGNVVSLVTRVCWERKSMQCGFGVFVTHLGIADFLMGIYLLIIAVADKVYTGTYIWHDHEWRHSSYCKIAGALSTLSSEASTFFICLITLDRFLVIKFPFSLLRFRFTSASTVAVFAWVGASLIAFVPLIPPLSHWKFYVKNGVCLALPFATERHPGWIYSVAIFTGLNFVAFIFIAVGQYSIYRAMKEGSMVSSVARRAQDMAIARKLIYIVLTDFFCWFPIGILSILALNGVSFGGEVYAWTAVFILPVNSALNPFLYTMPVVIKKIVNRKQLELSKKKRNIEVYGAQLPVKVGDPDSDQLLLESALRLLTDKADRDKLIKDICEALVDCSTILISKQPKPNSIYVGIRGKACCGKMGPWYPTVYKLKESLDPWAYDASSAKIARKRFHNRPFPSNLHATSYVVDSVCLATRTETSCNDLITSITSFMNIHQDGE